MFSKALPNYTTERYYLLSEIEQRSQIINFKDNSDHLSETKSSSITIFYLLYDHGNENAGDFLKK